MTSHGQRETRRDLQKLIRLITVGLAVTAVVKDSAPPPRNASGTAPSASCPTTCGCRRSPDSRSACGTRTVRT